MTAAPESVDRTALAVGAAAASVWGDETEIATQAVMLAASRISKHSDPKTTARPASELAAAAGETITRQGLGGTGGAADLRRHHRPGDPGPGRSDEPRLHPGRADPGRTGLRRRGQHLQHLRRRLGGWRRCASSPRTRRWPGWWSCSAGRRRPADASSPGAPPEICPRWSPPGRPCAGAAAGIRPGSGSWPAPLRPTPRCSRPPRCWTPRWSWCPRRLTAGSPARRCARH